MVAFVVALAAYFLLSFSIIMLNTDQHNIPTQQPALWCTEQTMSSSLFVPHHFLFFVAHHSLFFAACHILLQHIILTLSFLHHIPLDFASSLFCIVVHDSLFCFAVHCSLLIALWHITHCFFTSHFSLFSVTLLHCYLFCFVHHSHFSLCCSLF